MTDPSFDQVYAAVPAVQRQLLVEFRRKHSYRKVDMGDGRWRYLAGGQGARTLLFLPGGFLKADMYFYPIHSLEDAFRFVAPDAYALQDRFAMDDVCRALVRSLDAEGVEQATVIGVSAGGGVAQYLLQAYPERVESVVFSHCGILEPAPEADRRLKRMQWMVKLLPLFMIRRQIVKMMAGNPPASTSWIAFHDAYFREAAPNLGRQMFLDFLVHGAETRRSFVFKPKVFEAWPGQVLIISSRDDEATCASLPKLQARYPRASTHVFSEGGHHTFMYFPEEYTRVLKECLASSG